MTKRAFSVALCGVCLTIALPAAPSLSRPLTSEDLYRLCARRIKEMLATPSGAEQVVLQNVHHDADAGEETRFEWPVGTISGVRRSIPDSETLSYDPTASCTGSFRGNEVTLSSIVVNGRERIRGSWRTLVGPSGVRP